MCEADRDVIWSDLPIGDGRIKYRLLFKRDSDQITQPSAALMSHDEFAALYERRSAVAFIEPKRPRLKSKLTPPTTSTDRQRLLRRRRKALYGSTLEKPSRERMQKHRLLKRSAKSTVNSKLLDSIPASKYIVDNLLSHGLEVEFQRRFIDNDFGYVCNVCDRLWYKRDLTIVSSQAIPLLREVFATEDVPKLKVCGTCSASLRNKRIPRLSKSNGFYYPKYPDDLPELDIVSERLISPRLPFMQIRRLRTVFGAKGLIGQVVNVPVDVEQMISALPRNLGDDQAFNVNIKRHQIHKSNYLSGYINKAVIKKWLNFLLKTELYKQYKITVNERFFNEKNDPLVEDLNQDLTEEERQVPLVEPINEKENDVKDYLLAKQQTLMWSDEQYLDLAPGMKRTPISLLYDEHAEELSFPSIYLGGICPGGIRLFFNTHDVTLFNKSVIQGDDILINVAADTYSGCTTEQQLNSAKTKVHKMKPDETGGLPYMIYLKIGRPYMLRCNLDVADGLVNGVIGTLKYVEQDAEDQLHYKRLWFEFENQKIGALLRAKSRAYKETNKEIHERWVPITKRSASIPFKSKMISCKRVQFPIVEACAITIHKSQGGSYKTVVYDYKKSHDQQLVYVALSRATSIDGLFLTNADDDFTFYHSRGRENRELTNEFSRLHKNLLRTVIDDTLDYINSAPLSICTFNVQSLSAHREDVNGDPVFDNCKYLLLCETWNENNVNIPLTNFKLINQFKRPNKRAGGVCVYEKMSTSTSETKAAPYELYKYEKNEIKILSTKHSDVGDICCAETVICGVRTLLISIYISPNSSIDDIYKMLTFNLMAYSSKLKNLFDYYDEEKLWEIPIIVGGDFNTSLAERNKFGDDIVTFMEKNFQLHLSNNSGKSTTRNGTCIDGVFSRFIPQITTKEYVSYFSYHRPLLSAIGCAVKEEAE